MSKRSPKSSSAKRVMRVGRRARLRFDRLEERTMLTGLALAEQAPYLPPQHQLLQLSGGFLSAPRAGDPLEIALDFAGSHAAQLGLTAADIATAVVTDRYTSDTGTTQIYLNQTYNGLRVSNATMNINVAANGSVINVGSDFVPGLAASYEFYNFTPAISGGEALAAVAEALDLPATNVSSIARLATVGGSDLGFSQVLSAPSLSLDSVPLSMIYVPTAGGGVKLAWSAVVRTPDGEHWYDLAVDATTGEPLAATDWIDHLSYQAFDPPTESPDDGPRTLIGAAADPLASPFGWHDTNGQPGAEYTDTRGNNVWAQEDLNADDAGGFRPDGGAGLNFNFPLNLSLDPASYQSAAITNLFYVTNWLHDVHYQYGFNEAAGDFQVNNYGRGGFGNDQLMADAQDGSGLNNANFATPPDGFAPRMQIFIFDKTTPRRDGALDNQVVIHEYGHGVSTRLTGGPANSNSLAALQSSGMGEGWSDWWALMFTQKATDTKLGSYGIGTYALGQGPGGVGVRHVPYSFDKAIDPLTYGAITADGEVHAIGTVWGSALWDMTWLLIDKYGFNPNVKAGYVPGGSNAGNILALKLVIDALKLQPANPSFLDGRDALLLADQVLTGGLNQQPIWTAFARRGMGLSASDGGNSNSLQVTEAFDTPIFELHVLSTNPAGGTVLGTLPVDFTVNLSQAYLPASVSASDLTVNGVAADSFNLVDNHSITFHFNVSPVVNQGVQTIALAAGSLTRLSDDGPLLAFSTDFRYDALPIQVTSTLPSLGTTAVLPLTSLTVNFNEPYTASSIDTTDLQVSLGAVTGFTLVDADTVSYSLSGVTSEGTFTWLIPAGAVTDAFGNPGPASVGLLQLDDAPVSLGALTPLNPRGSLAFERTASGVITILGDTDDFSVQLDASQTLSVALAPSGSLQPTLLVRGPQGDVLATTSAAATGQPLVLQNVAVATAGTYTITVGGGSVSQGSYGIHLLLNALAETEDALLGPNDSAATAQDLTAGIQSVGGGIGRAAVVGTTDGVNGLLNAEVEPNDSWASANDATANFAPVAATMYQMRLIGVRGSETDTDFFKLGTLQAGDVISITQSGLSGLRGSMTDPFVRLYRGPASAPVLLRIDDDSGAGIDSLIYRYTIPATDTYFVAPTGYLNTTGSYELGLQLEPIGPAPLTGGTLTSETEPNDTALTANDASAGWQVVGYASHTIGNLLPGDHDAYRYQFTAGDLISIKIASTATSYDSRVTLYNSAGQAVALSDGFDIGPGRDSIVLAYRAPTSGSYYVQVDCTDSTSGTYDAIVYLSTTTPPPIPIPINDFYSIHLDQGQGVSLVLAEVDQNLTLELQDAGGAIVASSIAGAGYDRTLQGFVAPTSGNYYARLTGLTRARYNLALAINSRFDVEPNSASTTAQELRTSGGAWGDLPNSSDVDFYRFAATANQTIKLTTSTPSDGPLEFLNTLDPAVDLYDPSGQLVATNDNSAGDGRNALISYRALVSGVYTTRVRAAAASSGEYLLRVEGANGPAAPLVVAETNPAAGSISFAAVSSVTVRFNDLALLTTLQASDLTIDGSPAIGVTIIDGATVRFTLAGPLPDGVHTLALAAGAVTDLAGAPLAAYSGQFTVNAHSSVVGRYVFYNGSKFDGNSANLSASDDAAIATDKVALRDGAHASFVNYTSYTRGLNGVMVDISRLPPGALTSADFGFRVGNSQEFGSWVAAPAPLSIDVRRGAGVGGSDRVTLVWADGAIARQWLEVTVKATAATLLTTPDVFYFGNAIGETGNTVESTAVDASDEIQARQHPQSFLSPAAVDNHFDFNRDGFVNAADQIAARGNVTTVASALVLINAPSSLHGFGPGGYAAVAAALAEQQSPADLVAEMIWGFEPPQRAARARRMRS